MALEGLRKRLTTAKSALGKQQHVASDLQWDTLVKYQDKLQPVFSPNYYEQILERHSQPGQSKALPKSTLALQHTLHVPIIAVTTLTVQPGEPHFILWLLISSFFPLGAACLAPLGNLISLIGLIQHWRVEKATGLSVRDVSYVFGLNVTSFVLGIVGNMSLLMNFSGKMKYLVSQSVSIFCWILAASILLVAILITNKDFVGEDAIYQRSEGFWLAVFTIATYYSCSIILVINFVGYKLDKYPPTFNLDKKQRLLMSYTIAFAVWQGVGTIAMAKLLPNLSYGASLYYCTESMLTIGLGDIVPISPGAKVFALLFSFIGVVIMGLIIATIRLVVLSSAGPTIFWHYIEKKRVPLLKDLEEKNIHLTPDESFHQMRLLRAQVRISQINASLALSIGVFLIFWLVGALIFHTTESWGYFNSVYFCFLCLSTIGYGDFHPVTAFGRAFFVLWAIAAIPLMTILISNVGDKLYDFADRIDTIATALLNWRTWVAAFSGQRLITSESAVEREVDREDLEENAEVEEAVDEAKSTESDYAEEPHTVATESSSDHIETDGEITDQPVFSISEHSKFASSSQIHDIQKTLAARRKMTTSTLERLEALQDVVIDGLDDPMKRYSVAEWTEYLQKLQLLDDTRSAQPNYWLSDSSPLRLPIKEPNYLLLKLFFRIEDDMRRLLELQTQTLNSVRPPRDRSESSAVTFNDSL